MKTVYNMVTGQAETIYDIDARERVERGGWSYETIDPGGQEVVNNKPVTEMTILQLRAYAKSHGITIGSEATTKEAVLTVIQAAEAEPMAEPKAEPKA